MVTEQVLLPVRVGTTCGSFVHAREAHFMQLENSYTQLGYPVPGSMGRGSGRTHSTLGRA